METQQGFTLWLTGMSGAGKSVLAAYLAKRLPLIGRNVELLDLSELPGILPEEADSSREIRDHNVRILGWAARLLTRNGIVPIVAAISPYRELREEQRREIGRFFEVFVDCPFETLMARDEKGIYRRALSGELQDVVGVQAPYEPPVSAEVKVDMGRGDVEAVAAEIFDRLASHGYISRKERDVLINGSGPGKAPAKAAAKATVEAVRAAAKRAAGESPAKGKATSKAAPKASTKATAEAVVKASAKPTPKAAAKPSAKAAAKPAPKPAKAAAKTAAKPAAKAAPAAKTGSKPAAKPAPKAEKAGSKPAAKGGAASKKPAARSAAGRS